MELTKGDFEILIEAIEEWEKSDKLMGAFSGLFGAMVSKTEEEGHKFIDKVTHLADQKAKDKKEIAAVLKAKLILMKNEITEQADAVEPQKAAAN